VITAPHGGREKPEEIADRVNGVISTDTNTLELAIAIAAEFQSRTGRRPHVVLAHLARRKLDCNREIVEAAAGNPHAAQAWREYHGFIEQARAAILARHGRGFLLDIHGHAHPEARLELGFLLDAKQLSQSDDALLKSGLARRSSLAFLLAGKAGQFPEMLRGTNSFGALLEAEGFRSAPCPREPSPKAPFFNGGYTTRRHTVDAASFAGLQIETHWKGVRDTRASRAEFARAVVNATKSFLETHAGLTLPMLSSEKK
jgi:N-formylglutamate amidohydrolase